MDVLWASEAVSGCNILILPIYASVLRPSRGGAQMAENDRMRKGGPARHGSHLDAGSGLLIAFALFSAKSGGTENSPVFRS